MKKSQARRIDLLAAVFITSIIWIVANEATMSKETIFAKVKFVAPEKHIVLGETTQQIQVEISGTSRSISRVQSKLKEPITITIGASKDTPIQNIDLLSKINELISPLDASIIKCSPEFIEKSVDLLIEQSIPLKLELSGAQMDGLPTIQPEAITLQIPHSLKSLSGNNPAILKIPEEILSKLTTGVRLTREADIKLPTALNTNKNVSFVDPPTGKASVTFQLKSKIDWKPIQKINIWTVSPTNDFDKFKITLDPPIITDLLVKLTDEELINIQSNQARLIAILPLSTNEKERGSTKKQISGCVLISQNESMRTVVAKKQNDQEIEKISVTIESTQNINGTTP